MNLGGVLKHGVLCLVLLLGGQAGAASSATQLKRADRALAKGQLATAEAGFRAVLQGSPKSAAALNGLGTVLYRQGKKAEALEKYRAAGEADPTFKLAFFNWGYASRKEGDYATAVNAYRRYVALAPEDPDGWFGLAESLRGVGDPDGAREAYQAFLQREKRPSEKRRVESVRRQLASLAVPAAPSDGPPPTGAGNPAAARHVAEARQLLEAKRYREASLRYQDALALEPDNVQALFGSAAALSVLGHFPLAVERWERAARLTTDATWRRTAEENIAQARAKMGEEVTRDDQGRLDARKAYEEGVRLVHGRHFGEAVTVLTRAVSLEPALSIAYVARGSALVALSRFAEAANDYQQALKLDPTLASPLYGLAEAYRAMDRRDEARALYLRYLASEAPDARPELQVAAREKVQRLSPP